jgi:hypothetical protein
MTLVATGTPSKKPKKGSVWILSRTHVAVKGNYRLLIDADVLDFMSGLKRSAQKRLLGRMRQIQDFPANYCCYEQRQGLRTQNPPTVSRQWADDFPQIRFIQEVRAFALHEMVTAPLT